MLILPGYVIGDQIHESSKVKVYKGYTLHGMTPVILKVMEKKSADRVKMANFYHEFEITRNLEIEGIIRPEKIVQTESVIALISRDFGAVSLKKYIQNHRMNIKEFLKIAIQLSDTLDRLHNRGIIHGDLKPGNILIDADNEKVYIIDFSSAISVFSKNQGALPYNPERTYEYMPPESTGRLNIGVDCRSDLYSLGVMFYELITGVTPFRADDPDSWVQAHITQTAKPPHEVAGSVPRTVSAIIMKLLEKSPDERYQSANGLLHDLKECYNQLAETGEVGFFKIGCNDIPGGFSISRDLVGRENEKQILIDAFGRIAKGKTETILVSGDPGIGKTMLVDTSLKALASEKGFYISGKFDQLKSSIPYAPFVSAFGSLIRQLMTKSEKELNEWKKAIQNAIGRRGAVIAHVIPEIEWIIGKQQPMDELPPKEAQNRFLMVFRDFVRVFARRGHPLVIFIDDLQWADYSSINLFKYLSRDANLRHILFVGAFRDNELNEGHPVSGLLEEMNTGEYSGQCSIINLKPLQEHDFAQIIARSLNSDDNGIGLLSEVLYRKTGGNPLFLGQLLAYIREEGLVYFEQQGWKWNVEAIDRLELGEDVLDLLVNKLDRLPKETREILKIAACIGNRFDIYAVSRVCGKTTGETVSCLMPALLEGLIVAQKQLNNTGAGEAYEFEFLHDRVQQAVYSSIPGHEKKEKHLAIGKIFLEHAIIEEKVMFIMDHFNRSIDLIQNAEDRIKLAGYNLMAGRKARLSAAYSSALQYFRSGRLLLSGNSWETDYKLSHDLYMELAQAEYLSANIDIAEKYFNIVIEKARNELERAEVYSLKVILYASAGKYNEAVHTGIMALRKLGVRIPINPTRFDCFKELLQYKWQMVGRKIESLEFLPEMKKTGNIRAADLLSRMTSVTMSSHPDLYSYLILKSGNFAVRYGNSEMACVGYLGYGITEGSVLGNYKEGKKYAEISLKLVEKYGKSPSKCIIYFVIGSLIHHWTKPAKEGLEYLKKAVKSAIEAGDLLIMGYAHCLLLENQFIMGMKLEDILEEVRKKREIANRIKHENLSINVEIYERTVLALIGKRGDKLTEIAAELNNEQLAGLAKKDNSSNATWHIRIMQLYYFMGEYRKALDEAEQVMPYMGSILGFLLQSEYIFYYSLIITAVYPELSHKKKRVYRRKLKNCHRQLEKWAKSCKENFEDMYLLVSAEIARINNQKELSMHLYDKAIQSAGDNRHIYIEALANELAAKYYLSAGLYKIAGIYMVDACRGYMLWGSYLKIKQLKNAYPVLTEEIILDENMANKDMAYPEKRKIEEESSESVSTTTGTDVDFMDRIIESIYSEPDINKLLVKFIDVSIKSIGAIRGYLILEKSGELYIEAGKDSSTGKTVTGSIPIEEYPDISKTVVRYVARTLETVVLNCDDQTGIFAVDPYIAESNPKSIACLPVLFQGISLGVLYFENNLIAGAFAHKRVESLKVLSSQVAFAKKFQSYLEKDYEKADKKLVEPLTERELEVLRLISDGMSNKEIADKMVITINTVKTYIKNIYDKLGVNRRVQVVARAKELNILQ